MLKTEGASSENTWNECSDINLSEEDWEEIYLLIYKLTMDTRIIVFQFTVTHRILACNDKMYTWKVCDTKLCHCGDLDTIEHYLVHCQAVDTFWKQFNWWAKNGTSLSIPIQTYEIIYGLPNPNNDLVILHYNYVILQEKYYISVNKKANKTLDLYEYLLKLQRSLIMKHSHVTTDSRNFERDWQIIQ
jgi:hypothetical protein